MRDRREPTLLNLESCSLGQYIVKTATNPHGFTLQLATPFEPTEIGVFLQHIDSGSQALPKPQARTYNSIMSQAEGTPYYDVHTTVQMRHWTLLLSAASRVWDWTFLM